MRLLRSALWRVLRIVGRDPWDRELTEELDAHVQFHVDDNIRAGMTPGEARRLARITLGGAEVTKERYRERRGLPLLETLLQDVAYGLRTLHRSPGFAGIAVLTLAVGIGATTAIFSLVNAVVIRSLPYGHSERLVYVGTWNPKLTGIAQRAADTGTGVFPPSNADFLDLQRDSRSFSTLALFGQTSMTLATQEAPIRVAVTRVTSEFFRTLEVTPRVGRTIDADDERAGRGNVAVLSDGLWQSQFGGDVNVLRRTLSLNGRTLQIVGVMPPAFSFPSATELGPDAGPRTDVWLPMIMTPDQRAERDFPNDSDAAIGRLRSGVSLSRAQTEVSALMASLDPRHSPEWRGWYAVIKPFNETALGKTRPLMWLLLGAVSLVLLIACGNAAHLLLARASSRTHEMGVRAALGAGRSRLIRQMLTEALLLAGAGGAVGVGIAYAVVAFVPLIDPGNIPRLGEASIDARVLVFSVCASLLTGTLFGLLPALTISRVAAGDLLKQGGGRGTTASSKRVRQVLIVMEVAVAVVLLSGAALLIRSYVNLQQADRGFSASTLTMRLSLDGRYPRSEQRQSFFRNLLSRIRNLPGVQAAGAVSALPLSHTEAVSFFFVKGYANKNDQVVDTRKITAQYFEAMGTRLVEGRLLTDDDVNGRPLVVVVNEAFARRYFHGETAIGRQYRIHDVLTPADDRNIPWSTIVGVVADVRHSNLEDVPAPQVYSSYWQGEVDGSLYVTARAVLSPADVAFTIRKTVQAIDPVLAVADIHVMDDLVSEAGARRRFQTALLSAFAAIAVGLAAVGLYGLMAYLVKQRTAEIGIRLALGARPSDVLKMILGHGMGLTGIGLALGVAGSFGVTRLLKALLYGVTRTDPFAFGSVLIVLMSVALLACGIPAMRACRVDPSVALREE